MEMTGTIPRVGLELDDLGELLARPGPFATAYVVTDGTVENAAMRSEQRWKTLRRRLADEGAPEDVLAAIDALVPDAHHDGPMLAVVADASGVLLVEHLAEPLDDDRCSWARLPDLAPLIRSRQSQPAYVLALADRGGADLVAERPGRQNIELSAGDGDPDRKVKPGGWSQRRYQERAENDWASTAGEVATRIVQLVEAVDARLVILGGDVRATQLIRDALPGDVATRTHVIDQGRAADGSEEAREREIRRLVATAVAEDTVAVLEKFKEERGQHDKAVEGAAATVEALNRAAVEILLVHDEPDRRAWVGGGPVPIGLARDDAAVVAGEQVEEAPLVDALVHAAIGTGATVRVVPEAGPVSEGIGALLRWSTDQT